MSKRTRLQEIMTRAGLIDDELALERAQAARDVAGTQAIAGVIKNLAGVGVDTVGKLESGANEQAAANLQGAVGAHAAEMGEDGETPEDAAERLLSEERSLKESSNPLDFFQNRANRMARERARGAIAKQVGENRKGAAATKAKADAAAAKIEADRDEANARNIATEQRSMDAAEARATTNANADVERDAKRREAMRDDMLKTPSSFTDAQFEEMGIKRPAPKAKGKAPDALKAKRERLLDAQIAEAERKAKENAGPDPKDADSLRKEFNALPAVKDFRETSIAREKMMSAAKDPSAAGDMALIFSFMKMLDPGSTVREGEYASAQNAAGVPARIRARWNNFVDGERLTAEQRTDFLSQASNFYAAQKAAFDAQARRYGEIAARRNLAAIDIIDEGEPVDERAARRERIRSLQAKEGEP